MLNPKYLAAAPTLTDGHFIEPLVDINGNLKVTQATKGAGEDLANDKMTTEVKGSYFVISTATTTLVKTGAGHINSVRVLGGTLGNVTAYDSITGSGAVMVPTVTPVANGVLLENVDFGTGFTIVTAAATVIVGSYR